MPTRISDLQEDTSPSTSSYLPVVVNGITRKTFLVNALSLVTGGTVTSITAGVSMSVTSAGSPTQNITVSFSLPGMVVPFAGIDSKVPTGWLFCNGQTISRTTYSDLFSVISTTYGAGDGSTTFALPDLRGRMAANAYGAGAIGTSGGVENVLLTSSQAGMKAHTHGSSGDFCVDGPNSGQCCSDGKRSQISIGCGKWTSNDCSQAISDSGNIPTFAGTDAASAHNNMPPGIVLNYLIKT
jgi:microcystin-dependent protein